MPWHIEQFRGTRRESNAIASVYHALFEDEPRSDYDVWRSEEWRRNSITFDSSRYDLRRFVAYDDETGEGVGYAQGYHTPWVFDPQRYHVTVRVHPEYERQGIGGALYDALLADLRECGATTLRAEVYDSSESGLAFAAKHGWSELLRSWQFTLATWRFDGAPFEELLDKLTDDDITITTVIEEAREGTGWLPKLHALHSKLRSEVRTDAGDTPLPIERFAQLVGGRAESLPDAFFIAKAGERYIGTSYLQRGDQPDALEGRFTGVEADYRGRGVAQALKLHAALYAQNEGYGRIVTWNESTNPAMVAVNRKLGWTPTLGTVWFEKRIEEAP